MTDPRPLSAEEEARRALAHAAWACIVESSSMNVVMSGPEFSTAMDAYRDAVLDAERARHAALVAAAQSLVDSAVLVPMAPEDDDDGPAEFWCVHPVPLDALRAALKEPTDG